MSGWKRRLLFLSLGILAAAVILVGIALQSVPLLVDFWWFDAQGYQEYFWHRTLYRFVVLILVGAVFFSAFFINFWIASHYLGGGSSPPGAGGRNRRVIHQFQTGSLWVYTPLSLILAVLIAWPLFVQWESFLLFITAPDAGIKDPQYGKDISYYLFSYPIYSLILHRLRIAFLVLLVAIGVLYWLENRFLLQRGKIFPNKARWHLSLLVGIVFLVEIWDFFLQRDALVYSQQYQPLFFGPGFADMRVVLPFIWFSLLFLLGVAASAIYLIHRRKGLKLLVSFALLFLVALGLRHFHLFHWAVNEYVVDPNEYSLQKPYIERSIKATLDAYDLNNIETRNFERKKIPKDPFDAKLSRLLRNIPVWNEEMVAEVYEQLQQLRTYYRFSGASVDRYKVEGDMQQVYLSGRELAYDRLPGGSQNWVNEHLIYTHGYGLVMTAAGQGEERSIDWLIRQMPLESDSFEIQQPAIYYGRGDYHYAVVPSENAELHYPGENDNVMIHYDGKGGIPITPFRRLIFASFFNDKNLLLTTQANDKSKILIRRNIRQRIHALTPFLVMDSLPYLAATSDGLYWIQDAYTVSSWYPNAERLDSKGIDSSVSTITANQKNLNYVRNSVKVVVDAYDGSVNYYIFDADDPIIQAFKSIYSDIFKDKEEFPSELETHVRYPKDMFEAQMAIYAKYHQTDPKVFYQAEDVWSFAERDKRESTTRMRPYYLTLDLIEKNRLDFILFLPMIVEERRNMRAMAVAGSDDPNYGKLVVHRFSKGELVFGPSQIHTIIKEDPDVSALFTLWSQEDSDVVLGNMVIFPIGGVVLYLQPVFLVSDEPEKIPRLERIILTDGESVVIEPTVEGAYTALKKRIQETQDES